MRKLAAVAALPLLVLTMCAARPKPAHPKPKPPPPTTTTTVARTTTTTAPVSTTTTQPASGGWREVFRDDFTTDVPLGSFGPASCSQQTGGCRWGAYQGYNDTSGKGRYDPAKVTSVHDGVLDIFNHTEGTTHYVSAVYPWVPGADAGGGIPQGRYEMRFYADVHDGYKMANLWWPSSGGSGGGAVNGEIDFPEDDYTDVIYGFIHPPNRGAQWSYPTNVPMGGGWHTAVLERVAGSVTMWLDGVQVGRQTTALPTGPMIWVIQDETSINNPTPNTSTGHLLIDWVAVSIPA